MVEFEIGKYYKYKFISKGEIFIGDEEGEVRSIDTRSEDYVFKVIGLYNHYVWIIPIYPKDIHFPKEQPPKSMYPMQIVAMNSEELTNKEVKDYE